MLIGLPLPIQRAARFLPAVRCLPVLITTGAEKSTAKYGAGERRNIDRFACACRRTAERLARAINLRFAP